jgi:hypothetical protein
VQEVIISVRDVTKMPDEVVLACCTALIRMQSRT